ncbi:hypothetical protein A2U01_0075727, partial [Trifolium medium]|nr:hypothetical protein [Trifolium medium]
MLPAQPTVAPTKTCGQLRPAPRQLLAAPTTVVHPEFSDFFVTEIS